MGVQIRKAGHEDAAALAEVGRDTFVETFAHLYPPADLAEFLATSYSPQAFGGYLQGPEHGLWLAEQDGRAIGYVQAGPCALPHREVTPACGEVKRLYVRQDVQGSGLGTTLLTTAVDWLSAPGRRGSVIDATVPAMAPREAWRSAFESLMAPVDAFGPDLILVSAGFDAHARDPLADQSLEAEDYAWATRAIVEVARQCCGGKVVSSLEGGYDLQALGRSAAAHVRALQEN